MNQKETQLGRPTDYTEELADKLCALIAEGSNINKLSKLEDWPERQTIYRWLREKKDFSDNYARALRERAETRFDSLDDVMFELKTKVIDPPTARVLMDAIKWQSGREDPKKYGDKIQNEITNPDGSITPQAITVKVVTKKD